MLCVCVCVRTFIDEQRHIKDNLIIRLSMRALEHDAGHWPKWRLIQSVHGEGKTKKKLKKRLPLLKGRNELREGKKRKACQKRMLFGGFNGDDDDDDDGEMQQPAMTRRTVTAASKIAAKKRPAAASLEKTVAPAVAKKLATTAINQRQQGPVFDDISTRVLGTLSTYDKKVRFFSLFFSSLTKWR